MYLTYRIILLKSKVLTDNILLNNKFLIIIKVLDIHILKLNLQILFNKNIKTTNMVHSKKVQL